MTRAMIHPYYGHVVVCGELDGQQHDQAHHLGVDTCDRCEEDIVVCLDCQSSCSCCSCGDYHALECEWPL